MGPAWQGDFVTNTADTAPAAQGGFPEVRPVEDAPPELGRFVAVIRRLHDLTVSTNPNSSLRADAAAHLESACALLDGHQVPETQVVAGRVLSIPGLGHPLMPPWTVTDSRRDGITMAGHFTEAHVGGNRAVHGGMIPLLYDWLLGMTVTAAGIRPTRTASCTSTTARSPRSTNRWRLAARSPRSTAGKFSSRLP
jgi:hypothetical protein